jgi:hypothetical protein
MLDFILVYFMLGIPVAIINLDSMMDRVTDTLDDERYFYGRKIWVLWVVYCCLIVVIIWPWFIPVTISKILNL